MFINVFRAVFFVIIIAVLIVHLGATEIAGDRAGTSFYAILFTGVFLSLGAFFMDILTPKKSLSALSGVFFALLVGLVFSWGLAHVVDMFNQIYYLGLGAEALQAIKWILGICATYLVITVVMRTKDDIRFVIPYVEFAKQTKGSRPVILDTSAIIDGRIADLCQSKLLDAPVIVPRFVLNELQLIADSSDKLKRTRGRRGLDILNKMQDDTSIDVEIEDLVISEVEELKGVDQKLVAFSKHCNGRLCTTDYNLSKVAQVRGVDVININDLANLLKTVALPGEEMKVRIIKPGEEQDQGVGYLDDGTMVVVEGGRDKIGQDIRISITSSLQTSAGKMIFGKYEGNAKAESKAASAGRKPFLSSRAAT